MFYVYLIENTAGDHLYIGYTSDLKRRLKEHNQGLNFSTRPYKPWNLIYYEACIEESDARRREQYLKTNQGRRLVKRRLKDHFYQKKNLTD